MKVKKIIPLLVVVIFVLGTGVAFAAGPTGAIFTTTPDGSIVNENVRYDTKLEVYLDGGPGPNAPQTAAGLDDGWYVFQVTDPSGKYLLSMDPSKCRVFEVEEGVIVGLVDLGPYETTEKVKGVEVTVEVPCHIQDEPDGVAGASGQHDTNIDTDHGLPAIVVQLMPFGDTPNPGGVYKAWAEKYDTYLAKGGDLAFVPVDLNGAAAKECPDFCAARDAGFGPPNTDTKTDNFKVKKPGKPFIPPVIHVRKFHDKNANGVFDDGDEWVTGWKVDVTDPLAVTNPVYTPETIVAEPAGDWVFDEDNPAGTLQTASYVDAIPTLPFPTDPVTVSVVGASGETHDVVFGNVGLGEVTACKRYALGDAMIPGWKIQLSQAGGVIAVHLTGSDGCTTFSDLLPGEYTLTELMPLGLWYAKGETSYTFAIESKLDGSVISGGSLEFTFCNYCTGQADFDTKGYWHNKNGLSELIDADAAYVNGLDPYDSPSDYFEAGDEPFDGFFQDGTPVEAAYENDKITDGINAGAGTWKAEVSHFLVDSNAGGGGGDQEQLAQQLLAFIFNVRHRLDGSGAVVQLPDGTWQSAQSVIDAAIAAWASGTTDDDKYWEPILDSLNNNDAVPFIHFTPCPVIYP